MKGQAAARARANVAVLDDEPAEADKLQAALELEGNRVSKGTDIRTAETILECEQLDAASIDWEWLAIERGPDLLGIIDTLQPETGRVVFTKHERRVQDAIRYGADFCLVKSGDGGVARYRETMQEAIRLGLGRRIVKRLGELGETNLPPLPVGKAISDEDEAVIYEAVVSAVARQQAQGDQDTEMRKLLLRRGWLEDNELNLEEFSDLSWHRKVATLSELAHVTAPDLATVLSIDPNTAAAILDGDITADQFDAGLLARSDQLLSALAFVLRLCDYDPGMMPFIWRASNLFAASRQRPPWDSTGLGAYLRENGPNGLNESIKWIRSH